MKALNLMTLVALLPGCAMMDNMSKPRHDPEYVPAQPASYQMPKSNNG